MANAIVVYREKPKTNSWACWMVGRTTKQNKNNLVSLVGKTGSGKTYTAISICEIMSKMDGVPFTIEHIVFSLRELMDLINIEEEQTPNLDSIGGKIWNIVENSFPIGKFTSSEILEKYEDEYNEPIKLSIISTYLARFAQRNKIERARIGREWSYQIIRIAQKHP